VAPGAAAQQHCHPGVVVPSGGSGTCATTFFHGTGQFTRAAAPGETTATATAETGDLVASDRAAGHTVDSSGDEPVVLIVSVLLAADQPGLTFGEATRAP
jgi:oxalate decarboxylase/phosphoglucose isomerase-like protein (cupin superfamily)